MQPYYGNMSIKIPYMRKGTSSTLIALSAAIALLLLASPLVISNFLLQPVQAQTAMSFRTPTPAEGTMSESPIEGEEATLTFDAQGTRLVTPYKLDTNGAYQITSKQDGKILASGSLPAVQGCCLANDSSTGKPIHLLGEPVGGGVLISTSCSTLATNHIDVLRLGPSAGDIAHFQGPVECSPSEGGGDTTAQSSSPSSSLTGSSQGTDRGSSSNSTDSSSNSKDGDSDGIPDSSDRCPNNSHHRCFKEGDTSTTTTTTHEQQPSSPSSSSNRTGNQTR
jgi:hypothetical protein